MKEARHKMLYTVRVHLYDILKKTEPKGQKPNQWLPGSTVRLGGLNAKGLEETFWVIEMF